MHLRHDTENLRIETFTGRHTPMRYDIFTSQMLFLFALLYVFRVSYRRVTGHFLILYMYFP